jgi:TPR repeat protein
LNGEPDNRPTINQVVAKLKPFITKTNMIMEMEDSNVNSTNSIYLSSSIDKELSQHIQQTQKILFEKDIDTMVNKMVKLIFNNINKGKVNNNTIFDNYDISSKDIYDWLLYNQNNSDSIFLLGYFNYYGIEISKNNNKAFNLFLNASKKNHTLAQYFVGLCYEFGNGTVKNVKLALEYYKKVANQNCVAGEFKIGYFHYIGIGIKKI